MPCKPWYRILYVQVLIAVALGIIVGAWWKEIGAAVQHSGIFGKNLVWPDVKDALKPLGDGFIKLVKMMIGPIIFCTVVHGVASMGDLRKLGRVGLKSLIYFEVVSTLALIIGLVVVNVMQPGAGFAYDPASLKTGAVQEYTQRAHAEGTKEFLLKIIPDTFLGAFTSDNLLQVLFVSLMTAFALVALGGRARPVLNAIEYASQVFFAIMRIVVKAAPIGAFGAMAFTVGSYGLGSLGKLLALMAGFYLTAAVFIVVVLGGIALWCGISIFRLLGYLKDELLLVLGTSSSETALPSLIEKMQRLGCPRSTVGVVVPTGYSFNLDGTNIYMTMATMFLAQATGTPLDLKQQIGLLLVAMLTSKGASGVTGAGFVTLAATLSAMKTVPVESMALLLGIDRFMSECRSLTNFIGNSVATIAVTRWEKEVTPETLRENLRNPPPAVPHAEQALTDSAPTTGSGM
jgi:aerobic C4-dicarboxylate transport protein